MTLYEMTNDMIELQAMLEEDDSEAVQDTLEMVAADFAQKAEGYGIVIKQMEAEAEALRKEEQALAARRRSKENGAKRLKDAVCRALELTGQKKLETARVAYSLRASKNVVIDDFSQIPEEMLRFKEPEADKTKIREYLKLDLGCKWAHIETKNSLIMK